MILHNFTIALSRKQASEFRKVWDEHGKNGGLIICQVGLTWGPFQVKNVSLDCAMLDTATRNLVSVALGNETPPSACTWTVDDDGCWHTGCGEAFEFNTDGPIENKVRFCHGCGKPVKVQETKTTNEKGTE